MTESAFAHSTENNQTELTNNKEAKDVTIAYAPRETRTTVMTPVISQTTAAPIIDARSVDKVYSTGNIRVEALRGVSLQVKRGEMVAVMGSSGCGKTTLLNCMSGLDRVNGGQVLIDGTDLATMTDREKTAYRARNMGFIFQTYNLLPVLSAVENVELPLVVSGVKAGQARKAALAALDRVELADRANNWPAQLSGGQRQRVTIARALVNDPAIVWADEPTGALDSKTANDIITLMETLNREQGQTFVIVTHDPGVGARCDRLIRMSDGEIVGEETK
jgi:ABC-type lipoprotein export system ATPase subunit